MDCEKFDNVMLDELYGELDELTSAAAKRHLSGCARCAAQHAGLKATLRLVRPQGVGRAGGPAFLVEPPDDLEDRIFARVKEAQKVVPLRVKALRLVSLAGSWAMRPQTQMAAVFLLMIGSSVLFMRGSSERAPASFSVAEDRGMPAPSAAEEPARTRMDYAAAASAHGTEPAKKGLASGRAGDDFAKDKDKNAEEKEGRRESAELRDLPANAPSPADERLSNAGPSGGAPLATTTPPAASVSTESTTAYQQRGIGNANELDRGMNQYREKRYDDAVKTLDGLSGSPDAALYAARAVRDSQGCAAAIKRYEDLTSRMWGTNAGYEATMDVAACYKALGQADTARARYSKLLSVPMYATRAQEELDKMRPLSVSKPAPRMVQEQQGF